MRHDYGSRIPLCAVPKERRRYYCLCLVIPCIITALIMESMGYAAVETPSYQVTNKTVHCIIENMEPCPAYDQIHVHVYDDIQS